MVATTFVLRLAGTKAASPMYTQFVFISFMMSQY